MANLNNKCQFIGNVGKDPETLLTTSGKKKVTFSIATTKFFKDKTGEKKSKTDWHNIVAWVKLADIIEKYVKKGHEVIIEAEHISETFEDKEGVKRYSSYFLASDIKFRGKKTKDT